MSRRGEVGQIQGQRLALLRMWGERRAVLGAQAVVNDGRPRRLAVTLLLCALGASLTALPPAQAEAARPLTYFVWQIDSLGVEEPVAQLIERMFRDELKRVLGDALLVESRGLDLRTRMRVDACGATTECLAEAGGALGVDRVIVGTTGMLGSAYSLNLKLIDARSLREARRSQRALEGDRAKVLEGLQALIFELIDPTLLRGSLAVEVPLDGATILVDGVDVGKTPLAAPIGDLTTGEHTLKVTSPLIEDYFTFFTVHYGKTTVVRVDAEQIAALRAQIEVARSALSVPVYRRWWFWTAAALVVSAGAASVALIVSPPGGNGPPTTSLGQIDLSQP